MSGYVTAPGGVFLHLEGGEVKPFLYGDFVDDAELASYQVSTAQKFLDGQPRREDAQEPSREETLEALKADASIELAAVPSDYGKLDEAEAQGVMRVFDSEPTEQAQVYVYESLHGGRQSVLDTATPEGKAEAEKLLSQIKGHTSDDSSFELPPPTGPVFVGTPEFDAVHEADVVDPDPEPEAVVETGDGDTPPPSSEDQGESDPE